MVKPLKVAIPEFTGCDVCLPLASQALSLRHVSIHKYRGRNIVPYESEEEPTSWSWCRIDKMQMNKSRATPGYESLKQFKTPSNPPAITLCD
ncbi:hypothetical protein GN956_G14094 [Arapaima gigas]